MGRTWKCPECGHAEEIRYDWLARHGGPVCEHCDCDMILQPEAEVTAAAHAAVVARLVDKAEASGLTAEDIDELVHEFAASLAADVNNGGLGEQLRYLVEGLGAQRTEQQLDELVNSQPREGE
jgi:hypothetical protein